MTKWVYTFGDGAAEGRTGDRELLGGKGANLAEMCSLGLPVPPGFTITTGACNHYYANGKAMPPAPPVPPPAAPTSHRTSSPPPPAGSDAAAVRTSRDAMLTLADSTWTNGRGMAHD